MNALPVLFCSIALGQTAEPTRFELAKVEKGSIRHLVIAPARLRPKSLAEVAPTVIGTVSELLIEEGDAVRKGQVLLRLDSKQNELRLENAQAASRAKQANLAVSEAELEFAKKEFDRIKALVQEAVVKPRDLQAVEGKFRAQAAKRELAKAEVRVAELALEKAKQELEACSVRAPMDAVVHRMEIRKGMLVGPGTGDRLLLKPSGESAILVARVPGHEVTHIRPGQPCRFRLEGMEDVTHNAAVQRTRAPSNPKVDRSFEVILSLPKPPQAILGTQATVSIDIGKRENVLLVPNAALRWQPLPEQVIPKVRDAYREWRIQEQKDDPSSGVVWVPEGKFVRPVAIRLGASDGVASEIVKGQLTEGVQIVTGLAGASALVPPR